ncbi:hypothetical protein GGR52DRAFT_577747 [Hypoxylon sp. FL1284]|nr:hypothetical protein GGR52DRAFT_577747 [Hypoxylon sp. FL1284]
MYKGHFPGGVLASLELRYGLSQWSQFLPPRPKFTEINVQSQDGKAFLITGGASGVGLELAEMLCGKGARVYIAGHSQAKAEQVIKDIRAMAPALAPVTGSLHFLHLELDGLSSIKSTVETLKAKESKLHVLWNNAGVSTPPLGSVSKQGINLQLATNCLEPFLLTQLLMPLLRAASMSSEDPAAPGSVRVVWAASQAIELSAPPGVSKLYTNSKTGNWFLAAELARCAGRPEEGGGIVSVAHNPGAASTRLFRHTPSVYYLAWPLLYTPRLAALTPLYAGLSADVGLETNGYYIVPWGRISTNMRQDLVDATKSVDEGGSDRMADFWEFYEEKTRQYQ